MKAGLNALSWGLPRLAIVLGAIVLIPIVAYMLLVTVIVIGQAAAAFGQ